MVLPTTLAELKEWLSIDSQAVPLLVRGDGRRQALVNDADVQAAILVTEETGETLQVEVRSLPPYSGVRTFRIPARPRTAEAIGPPCRVASKLRGRQPPDAKAADSSEYPSSAPGLDILDLAEDKEACLEDPARISHCCKDSTSLVEALGLADPYAALCRRVQRSADFVEESLHQHRLDVALDRGRIVRPPSSSAHRRPKVHSRDLAKLRGLLAKLSQLQSSMNDVLLQRHVVASWEIPDALPLLAQDVPRRGGWKLRPRRKFWCSSCSSLGLFADITFRLYPAGDGDAAKGDSVIYFWAEVAPRLSFAFTVQVGETEMAQQTWYQEVAWARVEFGWELMASELTNAEAFTCGQLPVRLKLLHWYAASSLAGSQPEQSYRDR
mmetsp:Transcript_2963/g.6702  ORF Transcript_2963/g.6702 Transcript_2963/m.6702 type:complete len:382 (-) Transcript_2963:176-1321(-)